MNKRFKHIPLSEALPAIEAESVFVQVALQIIPADVVIDASNAVLGQAPESLDRVRMRVARDVNLRRVVDALVLVSHPFERVVGRVFVGKDRAFWHRALDDVRHQGCALGVWDNLGNDSAFALDHTENRSLADSTSAEMLLFARVLVFLQAAERAFVHFDLAGQLRAVIAFIEHRANLFEHAPRAFVGDAKFTLKLLCRNSAPRLRHQVNRVKPELQRGGRVLKDRAPHRMLMMAAKLAAIGRSRLNSMMLGDFLAFRAINSIRIKPLNERSKTSRVIGIFPLKLHQRVSALGCSRPDRTITIDLAHTEHGNKSTSLRQGDNYPNLAAAFSPAGPNQLWVADLTYVAIAVRSSTSR
jgi:hypothetical protein